MKSTESNGPIQPGQVLGNYVCLELIGQGAHAQVWKVAYHRRPEIRAMKIVIDPQARRQLARERQIRLDHPRVVPILDADTVSEDWPYLVMPYYEKGSLAQEIARHPNGLPEARVHQLLEDILSGLEAAHDQGIVHRDVKPHNVLIDDQGRALIADFGLSLWQAAPGDPLKSILQSMSLARDDGAFLAGTLAYMAPEVREGHPATCASDIYSVGVMLFEMLTGRRPFGFEQPSGPRNDLENPKLWKKLYTKTSRPPQQRYPHAGAMLGDLRIDREPPAIPKAVIGDSRPRRYPPPTSARRKAPPPPRKRGWGKITRSVIFTLIMIAVEWIIVGLMFSTPRHDDPTLADAARALKQNPRSALAYFNRGVIHHNQGHYDLAVAHYTRAAELHRAGGKAYYDQGDRENALAAFTRAIELNPHDAPSYYYRGLIHYNRENFQQAWADYSRALDINPEVDRLQLYHLSAPSEESSQPQGPSSPRESSLDLGNGVSMELILIPAGEFLMGSDEWEKGRNTDEGPQRQVRISTSFYMGEYEVTQAQWKAVMGANPSRFKGDDLPVENVSWEDCQEFCRKLSRRTGREIRLPTEAEWEYACRAGTTTPFFFGKTISTSQANYNGKSTISVKSFAPNAWGLYQMHGNVWE